MSRGLRATEGAAILLTIGLTALAFSGVKDGPALVGALGTVLTLAGTMWLATSERRNRDRQEWDIALITSVKLHLEVKRSLDAVTSVIAEMEGFAHPVFQSWLDASANILRSGDSWQYEDLLLLAPLPNHAAAKLALGKSIIQQMISSFTPLPDDASGVAGAGYDHDNCLDALKTARTALSSGFDEIRKIIESPAG
jgi:hypothetical protein